MNHDTGLTRLALVLTIALDALKELQSGRADIAEQHLLVLKGNVEKYPIREGQHVPPAS